MSVDPRHVEVAAALQAAFKQCLPPGFKVCAMIVDTTSGEPPFPMFVTRNVPADLAKEIAGAFADGKPSVTAVIVEASND